MSVFLAMMLAAATPSEAELGGAATVKERQGLHAHGQCVVNERAGEVEALLALGAHRLAMHNRRGGAGTRVAK